MNIERIYQDIITRAKSEGRIKGQATYYELHHIVPRSMGGSDDSDNLVLLTGREHFICHLILARMHPDKSIAHAAFKMACVNDGRYGTITSRIYESLRIIHAKRVSGDEEAARKKSLASKGRKQSENHVIARTTSRKENGKEWHSKETLKKISESRLGQEGYWKGKTLPKESIEKRKQTMRETGGWEWTEERRDAQRKRLTGKPSKKRPLTAEEKQKLREEKSKKTTCPHCGKEGSVMIMPRWHFNNCKIFKELKNEINSQHTA